MKVTKSGDMPTKSQYITGFYYCFANGNLQICRNRRRFVMAHRLSQPKLAKYPAGFFKDYASLLLEISDESRMLLLWRICAFYPPHPGWLFS
ncbi:MAG: hypothetical protein NC252_10680 [Roseburia sp.]|nr:hypothetical protein [Roseburia sp.]MCM1421539.1 hypothetical protein [Bacteroides sp.]